MSDHTPESGSASEEPSESGPASDKPPMLVLLESLKFYRNVRVGVVLGAIAAVSLYLVRTLELLPWSLVETREYPLFGPDAWFLLLAFVLAATLSLLVAILLTVFEAVRGARELVGEERN